MTITRDFVNPQLTAAFGLKGGGAALSVPGDLVATIRAFDLEESPWPPFYPFTVYANQNATPAAFSQVSLLLRNLNAGTPPYARVVIDQLQFFTTDASLRVDLGLVKDSQITSALTFPVQLMDATLAPDGGGMKAPHLIAETSAPAAKILDSITNNANATRVQYDAASVPKLFTFSRPWILKPGTALMLESAAANFQLNCVFWGRLFIGQ